jgi:hypothetical protein
VLAFVVSTTAVYAYSPGTGFLSLSENMRIGAHTTWYYSGAVHTSVDSNADHPNDILVYDGDDSTGWLMASLGSEVSSFNYDMFGPFTIALGDIDALCSGSFKGITPNNGSYNISGYGGSTGRFGMRGTYVNPDGISVSSVYLIFVPSLTVGLQSGVVYPFEGVLSSSGTSVSTDPLPTNPSTVITFDRFYAGYGYLAPAWTNNGYLAELYLDDFNYVPPTPEPTPTPPPMPSPSRPPDGGSMLTFNVPVYDGRIFAEDIVNEGYDNAGYSYVNYPYYTLLSFLDTSTSKRIYYIVFTNDYLIDGVGYFDGVPLSFYYSFDHLSGVVYCYYGDLPDNGYVTFASMMYNNDVSPSDLMHCLFDNDIAPVPGGYVWVDSFAPGAFIHRRQAMGYMPYCLITNYGLHPASDFLPFTAVSTAMKIAESYMRLVREFQNAGGALTQEIIAYLEQIVVNQGYEYDVLERIYDLLSGGDVAATLPPDDPISQTFGGMADATEWIAEQPPPDIEALQDVMSEVNGSIDNILAALGPIGILLGVGVVLGVLKVILQR